MRRLELAALIVCACKQDPEPSPPGPTPTPTPIASKDAATLVDLLRFSPTTVRVSSQVANPSIKPEHLVDRSFDTAWNSRTGQLAGAWIDVTVAPGVAIDELRLTAGHTGHGPHGEDYFTMNPRIRKVSVLAGDATLGTFPLDITKRDLQTVRVHGAGTLRIRVDAVERGSKPAWRETCVSELEVWGSLPAGMMPVASTPKLEVEPEPTRFGDLCAGIAARKAAYHAEQQRTQAACAGKDPNTCGIDEPGEPECTVEPIAPSIHIAPWRRVGVLCESNTPNYGPETCTLVLDAPAGTMRGPSYRFEMSGEVAIVDASVIVPTDNGPRELVVRYQVRDRGQDVPDTFEVTCTAPKSTCRPAVKVTP